MGELMMRSLKFFTITAGAALLAAAQAIVGDASREFGSAPGDPTRGKRAFSRGNCILCHSEPRSGTRVDPLAAFWDHGRAMQAMLEHQGLH